MSQRSWLQRAEWALLARQGAWPLPTPRRLGSFFFHFAALQRSARNLAMQALFREPALRYRCRHLGRRVRLLGPMPRIAGGAAIEIGDEVDIGPDCIFLVGVNDPQRATLRIGRRVCIGDRNIIAADELVEIGDYCRLGPLVSIYDTDIHPRDPVARRSLLGTPDAAAKAPVILGEDAWLGIGAVVLKGVRVGRGAIVGAGAVVASDVPDYAVVAGNPAAIIAWAQPPGAAPTPPRA